MTAAFLLSELQSLASPEKAAGASRYFKTGVGQYGEGDQFLGIGSTQIRSIAKANKATPLEELHTHLASPWHEARSCALLILVYRVQSKRTTEQEREEIYQFYLQHTTACNNWDLVDFTCRDIVGNYLLHRDRTPIYQLAQSPNLWEQRISIVSTWAFIQAGDFADTFKLALHFQDHPHDLIHKAVGWMLREVGKKDQAALTEFLESYGTSLPRTALRYAIERYPEAQRQYFLHKR